MALVIDDAFALNGTVSDEKRLGLRSTLIQQEVTLRKVHTIHVLCHLFHTHHTLSHPIIPVQQSMQQACYRVSVPELLSSRLFHEALPDSNPYETFTHFIKMRDFVMMLSTHSRKSTKLHDDHS